MVTEKMVEVAVVAGPSLLDIIHALTLRRPKEHPGFANYERANEFARHPAVLQFTLRPIRSSYDHVCLAFLRSVERLSEDPRFLNLTIEVVVAYHRLVPPSAAMVEIPRYDTQNRTSQSFLLNITAFGENMVPDEPLPTTQSHHIQPGHLVMAILPSGEALGKVISLPNDFTVYLHVVLLRDYDPESGVPKTTLVEPSNARLATLEEIRQGFKDWHLGNPNRLKPEVVQLGTGYAIRS